MINEINIESDNSGVYLVPCVYCDEVIVSGKESTAVQLMNDHLNLDHPAGGSNDY